MKSLRTRLHEIIFEADTPAGRFFDIALLVCILLSIFVVCLESMQHIAAEYGSLLTRIEWVLTILFTVEYGLRIFSVERARRYITSFYGIVDLMAILPTYLSVLFAGTQYFAVVRAFRLLRVFRILKLTHFVGEADVLYRALRASHAKITVFILAVTTLVTLLGSLMYVIEGPAGGFTSIPRGIYWAIVTLTTVGYGDITPKTPLGQTCSSLVMLLGYGIIAIPTGIVSVELAREHPEKSTQACPHCLAEGHDYDAHFCKLCGNKL